jgi:glycerol-3-phosphate dehydrogenase
LIQNEQVHKLLDLILRRSTIGFVGQASADFVTELAEIAAHQLGWSDAHREQEIADALSSVSG